MNTLRLGRLQVKLVLLVFIASLPALVVLFCFGLQDRERAIEQAGADLANIAHLASYEQETRLSGSHTPQVAVPPHGLSQRSGGFVFAALESAPLEASFSALHLALGTRLTMADRSGMVIASYPANPKAIGQLFPDKSVLAVIRAGVAGGHGVGNVSSASVLRAIDDVRSGDRVAMYTIASIDRAAVVSPIDQRTYVMIAAWLSALALAMAAAWHLGGRWISGRAASLSAVAQQIGAGNLGARTAFKTSHDELDQVGVALDRMAESLARREQESSANNLRLGAEQAEVRRMNLLLERKLEMCAGKPASLPDSQLSAFDCMPQLVWLADLDGSVTFANQMWSERTGVAAEDCKGNGWSTALHPEDLDRVMLAWRQAVSSKDHLVIKFRLLRRDGGYHHYEANLQKAFGTAGDPVCWVAIFSDVTDSRRRDNALRFANQELLAFYSAVSHDLRAPLRAVSGFSERLDLESAGRLDEKGRHYLDRIRVGAAKMNELIDDLLRFSRVTRTEIAMGTVDLSRLAQQVFDELRKQEPDHPVEIVIQDGMAAIGDARLLRVVLVNLIGNALKFSGKRDVSRIEIGENALPGDTSMFFVRDNGAGFDPAYAAKMFGIFQRLHSAKEFPGTGIGLATVQRIIHKHGGQVSAEGGIDLGAKICFWLRRK